MPKAVIFDLDGTVIESEDEYGSAFKDVLASLGVKTNEEYPHQGGIGVAENWPVLLTKFKIKTDKTVEELTQLTQAAYLRRIETVTLKPGFDIFVNELKQTGIKTALATSNLWEVAQVLISKLALDEFFDVVVTGENVVRKKPAPDLFLMAANKLNVNANDCLVFEDSPAGVEAAKRASMKVVGIYRSEEHKKDLIKADLLIKNFFEVTPEKIISL
jgi:beta-phosphoglucomutase